MFAAAAYFALGEGLTGAATTVISAYARIAAPTKCDAVVFFRSLTIDFMHTIDALIGIHRKYLACY